MAPSSAVGRSFNLAYGGCLIDMYYDLTKAQGLNVEPNFGPNRSGDIRHSNVDMSKARDQLGYEPEWLFERGIKPTIKWYKDNL